MNQKEMQLIVIY